MRKVLGRGVPIRSIRMFMVTEGHGLSRQFGPVEKLPDWI